MADSFQSLVPILLIFAGACASKPQPVTQTRPVEPGLGACKTTLEHNGVRGMIRYVNENGAVREIWDANGDGATEAQLRKKYDAQGRLTTVERLTADGTVVERVERRYTDDRLTVEETDRYGADGHPGPDGAVDWRRELTWEDGALVRETIDELDAEGLPGVDGEPEFVIDWTVEAGHRTSGKRTHRDGMVVATYALDWSDDRLVSQAIDFGADGTIDQTTRYTWRGDRVTRVDSAGTTGESIITHDYCQD